MAQIASTFMKNLPLLAQVESPRIDPPAARVVESSDGSDRAGDEAKLRLQYRTGNKLWERIFKNPSADLNFGPIVMITTGEIQQLEDKSWKIPFQSMVKPGDKSPVKDGDVLRVVEKGHILLSASQVPQFVILEIENGETLKGPKWIRINLPAK